MIGFNNGKSRFSMEKSSTCQGFPLPREIFGQGLPREGGSRRDSQSFVFFSMDVTERPFTTCLVGGLEHFLFFHSVGNFIIPTDFRSVIFQRGRSTTNQLSAISHPFPLPKTIPETNQQDVQPHPLLTFSD